MKRAAPLRRKTPLQRSRSPLASSGRISRKEPIARRSRVRTRNRKRHAKNWTRAYHSPERVAFIKALSCIVTGMRPSVNAHTVTGGASRKADYTTIVPVTQAVHDRAHTHGWAEVLGCSRESVKDILAAHAAETQAKWLYFTEQVTPAPTQTETDR